MSDVGAEGPPELTWRCAPDDVAIPTAIPSEEIPGLPPMRTALPVSRPSSWARGERYELTGRHL